MTLKEAENAMVTVQGTEARLYRLWKRQPNPTTYARYRKASNATGDAIKLWADLRDEDLTMLGQEEQDQ